MALYTPPKEIEVFCNIDGCNYTGTKFIPRDAILRPGVAFDKCPRCGYFTLREKSFDISDIYEDVQELIDASDMWNQSYL